MERTIRPIDMSRPEERLLTEDPPINIPYVLATDAAIRSRRVGHNLWVVSSAFSIGIVFAALVSPGASLRASAQAVTDGRLARTEEKLDNIVSVVAAHTAKLEAMEEKVIRLSSELEGAQNTIKFGGSILAAVTSLAAWFSRKKS